MKNNIKGGISMDAINEFLKRFLKSHTEIDGEKIQDLRPKMRCADGFTVSVQASKYHYCEPRIDGDCEYVSVELGYPNTEDPLIIGYAEDLDDPTETVYGYVPIELVNELAEKHGGIVNEVES